MRYFIIAALAVVSASVANAGSLTASAVDTPGLAGFQTVTFYYTPGADEQFGGFDATFTGSMNQVNPFGLASIFTDNNAVFGAAGAQVAQDSQFPFATSSGILTVGTMESSTLLKGAVSNLIPLGLSSPAAFAQIVTDSPIDVAVSIDIDNSVSGRDEFYGGTVASFLVPEPSTCLLAGLAAVGFLARRK